MPQPELDPHECITCQLKEISIAKLPLSSLPSSLTTYKKPLSLLLNRNNTADTYLVAMSFLDFNDWTKENGAIQEWVR
jgi:hypothetical protein